MERILQMSVDSCRESVLCVLSEVRRCGLDLYERSFGHLVFAHLRSHI